MKKAVYNLVFGKGFYPNLELINEYSPKEFSILNYKFVRHNNFKKNIKNLYYPMTLLEKVEYEGDQEFFEKMISNPELANNILETVQKDMNNSTYVKKEGEKNLSKIAKNIGGEYYKKEVKESIGGHQLTYEVELPAKEKPSVIYKDSTLLSDILLLLSIFTGTRAILGDELNRYWQKINLEMLEWNYETILSKIHSIISKFDNNNFNYKLHGKNIFYYLELNSTELLDLKFMILGTVLDSFSQRYVYNNESIFDNFIYSIRKWDAVGNTNKTFSNRLYFLLNKLFLENNNIPGKNDYYLKTDKFVEIRNQIVHNKRLFPADELENGNFVLSSDVKKEEKFKKLFPFTQTSFTHKRFFQL